MTYGLRYELNTVIREPNHLTSVFRILGLDEQPARYWDPGAHEIFLFDPQPPYDSHYRGWGPRLSLDWQVTNHTSIHAGGSIVTLLPNLCQDNVLTGGIPLAFTPYSCIAYQGAF